MKYNLNQLIEKEIENGYGDANAQAKVCQDIILKAMASSSLSRNAYIYNDPGMREKDVQGVLRRVKMAFKDRIFRNRLATTDKKWLNEDTDAVLQGIVSFLEGIA